MSGVLNNGLDKLATKQVTFNPNPVTIPSVTSGVKPLSANNKTTTTSSIKGTIQITDTADPNKVKNVLVSTVPTSVSSDHTYAKVSNQKVTESSSSSDDSSSESDSDSNPSIAKSTVSTASTCTSTVSQSSLNGKQKTLQDENIISVVQKNVAAIQATPTNAPVPKRRGRPRKTPDSAPPKAKIAPRSILKQPIPLAATPTTSSMANVNNLSLLNTKIRRRGRGCGTCFGCAREDCGKCSYCLDKPKYGGPGRKKQRCALRICSQFRPASNIKSPLTMPMIAAAISSSAPDIVMSPTTAIQQLGLPITTDIQLPGKPGEPPPLLQVPLSLAAALSQQELKNQLSSIASLAAPVPVSTAPSVTKQQTPVAASSVQTPPKPPPISQTPPAATTQGPPTTQTPPTTVSSSTVTPGGRTTKQGSGDIMKCIVCSRERKINLAKSAKFCTRRCLNLWVESNPGKNVDEAEATSCNLPLLMPPTTTVSANTPRAIKKLMIDMALPGTTQPVTVPSLVSTTTISNNIADLLSNSASGAVYKRSAALEQSILPPAKKFTSTGAATSVVGTTKVIPAVTISKSTASKKKGPHDLPVDVSKWTTHDVLNFFQAKPECQNLAPLLEEQEIDGQALLLLTHDSLVKCLGIKLGPALKLMIHIERLKQQQATHTI